MHVHWYPQGQKVYKLYDLEKHKIFVSRDVKFIEHILPYKQNNNHDLSHGQRLFPVVQIVPEDNDSHDIPHDTNHSRAGPGNTQASTLQEERLDVPS